MDLESVLIQVANGGQEPLTRLIIGVAAVVGIIGVIGYLISLRKQARHSTKGVEVGRIFAGIIFCVCLITLKAQMNSGGATLGFGDVSFGPVSYASESTFGMGAAAVNAALGIVRILGAYFFYRGIKGLKDSYLEGHTELSASGTRGASIVKIVCGLLLMFDTQTLDALQSTLNIHW
ncbi:conjugal transfer protein TraQ [Escherichia coli]|nr:conjugal transfer protein TraQ [Escherichia coli]